MADTTDLVLVTGASGFIARHVVKAFLDHGYRVRGTVRSREKGERVRAALAETGADVAWLEFVVADLLQDANWDEAVAGCRFVCHTASPFPGAPPRDKEALVPTAVGGTLRVIEAAQRAGVERLALTSSVVSIYHGHEEAGHTFTEADFSDTRSPTISSYAVSKTRAEQAAWKAVEGSPLRMAVLNPALVLGPLIGREMGTSVSIISMMRRGLMPIVPNARFGIVDVRDVASAHVEAIERPEAAGRRFILSGGMRSLIEIGEALRQAEPQARRLPRSTIPNGLIRLAGRFSPRARLLLNELDPMRSLDTSAASEVLNLVFRSPEEAIAATARSLRELAGEGPPDVERAG